MISGCWLRLLDCWWRDVQHCCWEEGPWVESSESLITRLLASHHTIDNSLPTQPTKYQAKMQRIPSHESTISMTSSRQEILVWIILVMLLAGKSVYQIWHFIFGNFIGLGDPECSQILILELWDMAQWEADHSSPTMKGMQQSTVFPWFIVPLLFDISLILPLNCNILIDEHKIENMKYILIEHTTRNDSLKLLEFSRV